MACALFSLQHYFSAPLLFFTGVLFWNVSCNFCSPSLAKPLDLSRTALMIVRVQNDFMKNGPVEVPGANSIISVINSLRKKVHFKETFVAKNWHPKNHISFAANHNRSRPFTRIKLKIGSREWEQYLWPVHCVQNTTGADIPSNLNRSDSDINILMAYDEFRVTKSVFRTTDIGSEDNFVNLRTKFRIASCKIETLIIVGIDVQDTVKDAVKEGFNVIVIKDACRFFDKNAELVFNKMEKDGVDVINSKDFLVYSAKKESSLLASLSS